MPPLPQYGYLYSIWEIDLPHLRFVTKAGLAAAKARGRLGGSRPGLSDTAKRTAMAAETLYKAGEHSVSQICLELGISRPTLYNYLRSRNVVIGV